MGQLYSFLMSVLLRSNLLTSAKAYPAMNHPRLQHLITSTPFFSIADKNYIVRPTEHLLIGKSVGQISFATVLDVRPGDLVNTTTLQERIAQFIRTDDVFDKAFLEGIIFQGAEESQIKIDPTPNGPFKELGIEWTHVQPTQKSSSLPQLPPGPYIVQNGQLSQIWRLYSDKNLAFIQSVWPSIDFPGEYTQVPFAGESHRSLSIAVPSRLHSLAADSPPLAGVRIGIKDLYHLKGVRTSLCNRAYDELYSRQTTTSPTIAHLISKGAQVVGKNHLSSFALQEHPTQSVEYESPFNPRADGYQIPGGSSSGSASAVASYGWLDFAICTDATGSVRIPALLNGCFGLRPSTNSIPTDGIVSVYPGFDTPGFLGRDLNRFHNFASIWYGEHLNGTTIRKPKIVVPIDFLATINGKQLELTESFISDLERALDTVAERRSIAADWVQTSPVDEKNIDTYLQNATLQSYYYEAYHAFSSFRRSYEEKFGRRPFVTEVNRWVWELGAQVTQEQHADMNERLLVFRQWFLEHYMKVHEKDSILILPISTVKPDYRDAYPAARKSPSSGLRPTYLSPYLGAPELVIPIGHIGYESRISGRVEHLPVAVSLLGPPTSDLALIQLAVDALQLVKRPTAVRAGTTEMWEDDFLAD